MNKSDLKQAIQMIAQALDTPTYTDEHINYANKVIDASRRVVLHYYDWCLEQDEDLGVPDGTTYHHGTNKKYTTDSKLIHDLMRAVNGS